MTWNEYQQWETETRAEITETAQRSRVSAGGGVSIDKGRVTVRRQTVIFDPTGLDFTQYFILSWLGKAGDYDNAGRHQVDPFGGVTLAYPVQGDPLKLTLQFLAYTSKRGQRYRYRYHFPVRVTLVQYSQFTQEENYREEPMRTVILDLKRDPVTVEFYFDVTEFRPQIVRLVSLTKT